MHNNDFLNLDDLEIQSTYLFDKDSGKCFQRVFRIQGIVLKVARSVKSSAYVYLRIIRALPNLSM